MSGILSVGASGLAAAYAALQTTGHNIANVSTPGFKRQQTVQTAAVPQFGGAGFIGNGVNVTTIERSYSELATSEVNRAQSSASEADTQAAYLKRLDALMGDTTNGVGVAVDAFFNSLQAASAQPSSTSLRTALLGQANNLATRFSETVDGINQLKDTSANDLALTLKDINQLGKQVAVLNGRISLGLASGQTPNDLMDQRDQLIQNISQDIGVTTIKQSDGSINVLVANGDPLVVGDRSSSLASAADPIDPAKIGLVLQTPNGNVQLGSNGALTGGKVAAMMNIHNQSLAGATAQLGQLAIAVAIPVNQQHQLGIDLNGNSGGDLFTLPAATVDAAVGNTGTANLSLSIVNAGQLKASDYQLAYNGATYQVTRLSDGTAQSFASLPATFDGFGINVTSGAMSAGDTFTLKPVSTRANGIALAFQDPSRLAFASPVAANAAIGNAGTVQVGSLIAASANVNLQQTVTLTFTGAGTFDVSGTGTGNPTGQPYAAGSTISFNGWTLTLTGTPRAGDSVTIGANANRAGDNRNALALAGFSSAAIVDGQSAAQSYAATLADVGGQAKAANLDASVQGAVRDDAVAAEQGISGVNLDEEAAKLMQYQQAYQASAKVIAAAQAMFDTILSLGR